MKLYISGPITGIKGYMEKFDAAEECLAKLGYSIVNPAKVNAQLPKDTTHEEYMKTSIAMLDMCDVIFLMDGWQQSKGCTMEFEYAYEHGISIVFEKGSNDILQGI